MYNMFGEWKTRVNAYVRQYFGTTAPVDGTTGAGDAGPLSEFYDVTNKRIYTNVGTQASPVWALTGGDGGVRQVQGTISSANITGTGAGQFGHANGFPLVAAPGATNFVELISGSIFYDFVTAAYTAGGNTTINYTGGAAVTGLISAANSFGAAVDKNVILVPLATAGINPAVNTGLSLVTSAAFTQPGTAAGTIKYSVIYRVIPAV